jgi:hypothetical protein
MKTKEFAKLLEVIVRKVVREEMKPLLKEIKNSNKPIIKETKSSKVNSSFDPFDVSDVFESKPNKSKTKYSGNEMLNDMLNETYENNEWRDIDSPFTSQRAQAFNRQQMASALGYGEESMIPDTDVDGKPVDMSVIQSSGVADALTRDYSSLMKTINAKKGK